MRIRFHHRFLKKQLPAHPVRRSSVFIENARSIGLLFDATDPADRQLVLRFAEKLKSQGKQVRMLGFFDAKLTNSDFPFQHFDKKQLDWAYRPKSAEVLDFPGQSFDLLINLSQRAVLPLNYLAALSKARFRIGPYTHNTACYDLMIEHDEKKGLETFLSQVLHYLKKMQPEQGRAAV